MYKGLRTLVSIHPNYHGKVMVGTGVNGGRQVPPPGVWVSLMGVMWSMAGKENDLQASKGEARN